MLLHWVAVQTATLVQRRELEAFPKSRTSLQTSLIQHKRVGENYTTLLWCGPSVAFICTFTVDPRQNPLV